MEVKSVYNFVPAPTEEQVFKPDWAEQVSHDIPFSDGESGEIELTITAKTPIFIRNGHSREDKENNAERYLEFSNVVRNGKKEFFIPATSVKGMIRNVLEILSFSRMKQVGDDRYSFRDLSKSGNLYLSKYKEFDIQAGWLTQDKEGKWKIEECEELAFIHHEELKKKNYPFRDLFLNKQPEQKTAKFKYNLVDKNTLEGKFTTYTKELFGNVKRTMARFEKEGGQLGTLVFTGQSSKRNEYTDKDGKFKANGKVHEFVFFSSEKPIYLEVNEKMQKDFKFIYLDHDKQNISKDWKFWRERLETGEKVPVFFSKNNNEVKHFGLAYMYKLPYEYSVKEIKPIVGYNEKELDLAELIFGSVEDKENALKGRIFISHAFAQKVEELAMEKEILASPKASYFPYYVEQTKNGNPYITYMDKEATLRGYKRYPVQDNENLFKPEYDHKQLGNEKVFTFYKPLNKGAEFKCNIRFHNLRKVEIGALISAITFHGTEKKSFHSIGSAKPFGYGKVQLSEVNLKSLNEKIDDYLIAFEKTMEEERKGCWLNSKQITELLSMAQYQNDSSEYPDKPKTFVDYKNQNQYLPNHSETIGKNKIQVNSIVKQTEILNNIQEFDFDNTTYKNLKKQVNELNLAPCPDNLQDLLKSKIVEIFNNHSESKRKLSKKKFDDEYEWYSTITTWFGKENAFEFYKELTGEKG